MRALAAVSACVALAAAAVGAATAAANEGSLFSEPVRSRGGVVASENRLAAEAGLAMLDSGGNAMDAAAVTIFAVGVTRHELCGIGGGGFLVYRGAGGETAALDFRETAPQAYDGGRGLGGGAAPPAFGTGHDVAGVPGTVAGMAAALDRYGTRSLADAIAPAERLAREGYPVSGDQSALMDLNAGRLRLYEESARTYLKGGSAPYEPGERIVLGDLAASLRLVAERGPDAFYRGPIAEAIVRAMQGSGAYPGDRGHMTLADLAGYRAKWRRPLRTDYRGHEVVAMPPPTSAGVATIEMLNLLEGFELGAAGRGSADRFHLVAEAQKIAWADRAAYVGDPDFVDVPLATLTSKEYAARRRSEIDPRSAAASYAAGAGPPPGASARGAGDAGGHTTNVAAIDAAGNAVAVNCSIEQGYGSAVVAPGTGFLLNNQLTDFDPPGTANGPTPGKRPRSSMGPTIVVRDGRPLLVLGGAGGPTIVMGVTNAVIEAIDFGADPARAIDAERADARGSCSGDGRQLCMEEARVLPDVLAELRARGHQVASRAQSPPQQCRYSAGSACEYWAGTRTQAAGTDLRTGERLAASDPRNEGATGADAGRGARGQAGAFRLRQPRLELSVRPRRLRAGRAAGLRLRVVALVAGARRGIAGVRVRLGGRSAVTDTRGRARLVVRLDRPGVHRLVARRASFRGAVRHVRALPRR
ncbi:MAG TPA: gamma-glutamyltransferase [Thermoleophilaceae bacterium]